MKVNTLNSLKKLSPEEKPLKPQRESAVKKVRARDTWCPVPWLAMGVKSIGDLRYCCHANASSSKGLLADDSGRIYNLNTDSIDSGMNAELIKDVRRSMLQGVRHPSCHRCYMEEDMGGESRRQAERADWPEIHKKRIESFTLKDGSIDAKNFPLRYLDLRLGNRCNLKCKMCNPTESDRWYEAHTKIWKENTFHDSGRTLKIRINKNDQYALQDNPYNWHENPRFWQDVERHIDTIERIYFVGGEPLLIESHLNFLRKCVDNGRAASIILEYNSNITALNQKILDIWKSFKRIEIGVSIDGVGKINDYIRYPSRWENVFEKLKILDMVEGNYNIWWTSTIQVYNMLHLPQMMFWILDQNFKRINQSNEKKKILSPHPLHKPDFLSIKIFPEGSKVFIFEHFQKEKKQARDYINSLNYCSEKEKNQIINRFNTVLDFYSNFMMSEDLAHLSSKFWKYTEQLDKVHGTSFKDACPQTYELMLSGRGV